MFNELLSKLVNVSFLSIFDYYGYENIYLTNSFGIYIRGKKYFILYQREDKDLPYVYDPQTDQVHDKLDLIFSLSDVFNLNMFLDYLDGFHYIDEIKFEKKCSIGKIKSLNYSFKGLKEENLKSLSLEKEQVKEFFSTFDEENLLFLYDQDNVSIPLFENHNIINSIIFSETVISLKHFGFGGLLCLLKDSFKDYAITCSPMAMLDHFKISSRYNYILSNYKINYNWFKIIIDKIPAIDSKKLLLLTGQNKIEFDFLLSFFSYWVNHFSQNISCSVAHCASDSYLTLSFEATMNLHHINKFFSTLNYDIADLHDFYNESYESFVKYSKYYHVEMKKYKLPNKTIIEAKIPQKLNVIKHFIESFTIYFKLPELNIINIESMVNSKLELN